MAISGCPVPARRAGLPAWGGDARGLGPVRGVALKGPAGTAADVKQACQDDGKLLLLLTGVRESLRILPPLNCSADEIDTCLAAMGAAFRKVQKQ